jgi:hypothetical protein
LYHQDARARWRAHAKLLAGRAFDIAGIAQPGLLQLQTAPFGDDVIPLVFEFTQVNIQLTVLMAGVDDSERADDYSAEGKNNYQ